MARQTIGPGVTSQPLNDNFTELYAADANHQADNVQDADGAHGLKTESGTFTPDRRKNYRIGIAHMRAVPGSLINNGGKGEYVRFPELQVEQSQKANSRFRKKHFSQNRELHATFRLNLMQHI